MKLDKIKQEMIEVGLITLYFFVCFAVFMIIKKLLLIQYQISFYGWATTIVGALAMGKVVFLIDKLPMHGWLQKLRPIREITLKALIYTGITIGVSILEKTIHFYLNEEPMDWSQHLFGERKVALFLAHGIYLYLCFVIFYFFQYLDRHIGREVWFDKLMKRQD
ncbi:hypothetical protein [Reichenbachiella sp.]|uniref:hypothetical protein n=1 Tax=Reichenbachiella sp. TaxID=2184521 RepID=UPI003BAE89DC